MPRTVVNYSSVHTSTHSIFHGRIRHLDSVAAQYLIFFGNTAYKDKLLMTSTQCAKTVSGSRAAAGGFLFVRIQCCCAISIFAIVVVAGVVVVVVVIVVVVVKKNLCQRRKDNKFWIDDGKCSFLSKNV